MARLSIRDLIISILIAINCLVLLSIDYICTAPKILKPPLVRKKLTYNRLTPLIFIGGFPRSGTTLMRVMLDAHPDIRCGQETRIIPGVLSYRKRMNTTAERDRLIAAGVTDVVIDSATRAYILEVILRHGPPTNRFCTKDPFVLTSAWYLADLFPQAKFIFMVRDGRASIHSVIAKRVLMEGYNLTNPRECLEKWNEKVATMYEQCQLVGSSRCMMVYYEQLVLHPAHWMREILTFLDVPWNESVLHHEDHINKPGGVLLSKYEKSTDQVKKPVYIKALSLWVSFYPEDVVHNMALIAPMLTKLGYDPEANPPHYARPIH